MGLERRGNNYYYYEKERDGEKVRSVYSGKGETALLFDNLYRWRRLEEEEESEHKQLEKQKVIKTEAEFDATIETVGKVSRILIDAFFLTSGFHLHKRQWRKKRSGKIKND